MSHYSNFILYENLDLVFEENVFISCFIAEEEAWISEKQQLLTVPDLGDNMAAVQGLIKKHDAFEGDISVHGERYVKYWFLLKKIARSNIL